MSRKEKFIANLNIQSFFNEHVREGKIGNEQMMYDPLKNQIRTRMIFRNGRPGEPRICTNVDEYPDNLIISSFEFPMEWIGPTISFADRPRKAVLQAPAPPPPKLSKVLNDTRPSNARRGNSYPSRDKRQIQAYFNRLRRLKLLDGAQLKYVPPEDRFYVRTPDSAGRFGPVFPCYKIDDFDDNLILSAKEFPYKWMGPTLGNTNYDTPPDLDERSHCLSTDEETVLPDTFVGECSLLCQIGFCSGSVGKSGRSI